MDRRKYALALKKVQRDIKNLKAVEAAFRTKLADHDVIDDYMDERKQDMAHQKSKWNQYLSEVDGQISKKSNTLAMDHMDDDIEEASFDEELPQEENKAATLVAKLDKIASDIEETNPKLAARLDTVSNTLEKKYGLK